MKNFFLRTLPFLTVLLLFVPLTKAQTHTVLLAWVAPSGQTSTYNVYRGNAAGACAPPAVGTGPGCLKITAAPISGIVTACPQSTAGCLSFVDPAPPQGVTSFWVVRAVVTVAGVATESGNSNEVSALVPLPPPQAPTGLTAIVR
jgi:hypothetical protein